MHAGVLLALGAAALHSSGGAGGGDENSGAAAAPCAHAPGRQAGRAAHLHQEPHTVRGRMAVLPRVRADGRPPACGRGEGPCVGDAGLVPHLPAGSLPRRVVLLDPQAAAHQVDDAQCALHAPPVHQPQRLHRLLIPLDRGLPRVQRRHCRGLHLPGPLCSPADLRAVDDCDSPWWPLRVRDCAPCATDSARRWSGRYLGAGGGEGGPLECAQQCGAPRHAPQVPEVPPLPLLHALGLYDGDDSSRVRGQEPPHSGVRCQKGGH
mmetsp:Transcript_24830/g.57551  ORF Transcript_24830/g.57551 Transcript_24830/m.57551 type:complete len:264 (+) Transcript_24830:259-1050(+)